MEWNAPRPVQQSQKVIHKNTCRKCYDASKPLYLEMDSSGIGLGVSFLQIREGMNSEHDKVQDNATLCPTAFGSKSLSSAQ